MVGDTEREGKERWRRQPWKVSEARRRGGGAAAVRVTGEIQGSVLNTKRWKVNEKDEGAES